MAGNGTNLTVERLLGVVGAGPGLASVLDLLERPDSKDLFPRVCVAAVAAPGLDVELLDRCRSAGMKTYSDAGAMLAAHPDLSALVDSGDQAYPAAKALKGLDNGSAMIPAVAVGVLWDLVMSETICGSCQTDLFRARALFATVFDEAQEDILLLDSRGKVVDMNRHAFESRGLRKEDVLGRHCRAFENCENLRLHEEQCPIETTLASGAKAEGMYTRVGEDGRVFYFRSYTYPVTDEMGRLTHIVRIRRDITRRAQMEQRLQQSEKLAAIGELSTYIAHEIRNPLFAIAGFANSLLRGQNLDEAARDKVGIILEESKRLDNILKSILNFARPMKSGTSDVDLNEVARETMELMRMGCEEKKVAVDMCLAPDIARAKGVPELLKQCLINMVKNSLEAMPGGGSLAVSTGMENRFVFLRVRDTGEGIAREHINQVFNPFFSTKDKGSGLGLAMTRKIMEDSGGRVALSSEKNVGTTVTLFLAPLLAVEEPAGAAEGQGGSSLGA